MNNIIFNPPRRARIVDSKYHRYVDSLAQMGLAKREFRVVKEVPGKVIVHPDDLSSSNKGEDFEIRRDIVEFLP